MLKIPVVRYRHANKKRVPQKYNSSRVLLHFCNAVLTSCNTIHVVPGAKISSCMKCLQKHVNFYIVK